VTRILLALAMVIVLAGPRAALAQSPSPSAPARPAPADGQGEFVPLSELPPAEQLPAAPLVLGAYGFIWATVLVYVFLLWRRLAVVQQDLDQLKRRTRS
jgi:CcmD family protein